MINLPLRSERPPRVRVLVADRFNNTKSGITQVGGVGPWIQQPMLTPLKAGLELLDGLTRPALPEIGECKLRMRYGVIDGKIIGLSGDSLNSVISTGSYDASIHEMDVFSFVGKEIRIQLAPDDGESPEWATVWWGQCVYETDSEWPASGIPVGERIYHCLDGLHRTKYWFMTRHAAYVNGSQYLDAPGHPGYNVGHDGQVLGNRETSGGSWTDVEPDADGKFFFHTHQGSSESTVWTDLQAAEHALRVSRPAGEPQFNFDGATALFTTAASPWEVEETDSAFDVLMRICARERGRGLVYLDWEDDPTGPLKVKLSVRPQVFSTLTYITGYTGTPPTTPTTATIQGAFAYGSTVDVSLIGDHRAVTEDFERSQRGLTRYDALETVGERIQVLITASRFDGTTLSLQDRFSGDDVTAFLSLDLSERVDEQFRTVFQAYGLPRSWQGLAMDHNAGAEIAQHRVDYRCGDNGAIINFLAQDAQGNTVSYPVDTSPLLIKVLPDTPLLEGYVYSGATPARSDAGGELGTPDRRPPSVWMRISDDEYLGTEAVGVNVQIKQDTIFVYKSNDASGGTRVISDTDENPDIGADYNTDQLGVTLAIELPHRLRFRSVRSDINQQSLGVRNTKRIEVPDAHLWLASPGALWDINGQPGDFKSAPGRRVECGSVLSAGNNSPGILRDDRARVSVIHALATAWYLQDHRPASWTLRACGLLPDFGVVGEAGTSEIEPTDTVEYPRLGQLVATISANGQTIPIHSPITGVIYNHQAQTTTWSCDWADLDVRRA